MPLLGPKKCDFLQLKIASKRRFSLPWELTRGERTWAIVFFGGALREPKFRIEIPFLSCLNSWIRTPSNCYGPTSLSLSQITERKERGRFCKRVVLANVPSSRFWGPGASKIIAFCCQGSTAGRGSNSLMASPFLRSHPPPLLKNRPTSFSPY